MCTSVPRSYFLTLEKKKVKKHLNWATIKSPGIFAARFIMKLKFDKQFKYAEKKNIPFVIIIGEEEIKENTCKVKNISTGEQKEIPVNELAAFSFK